MIKEAAIQRKSDGKVWTGRRHGNCISKIFTESVELGEPADAVSRDKFIQGFVTDDGQFVDRHEAFRIAKECGQIKAEPWAEPTLMSEDLY